VVAGSIKKKPVKKLAQGNAQKEITAEMGLGPIPGGGAGLLGKKSPVKAPDRKMVVEGLTRGVPVKGGREKEKAW